MCLTNRIGGKPPRYRAGVDCSDKWSSWFIPVLNRLLLGACDPVRLIWVSGGAITHPAGVQGFAVRS
jgi:hypothetical protein